MKQYNLIFVLNNEETKILMLHRTKDPYKGLYNLPGGKVESSEDLLQSAYRELQEETGITSNDITLQKFMDFSWHITNTMMHVFIGKLAHDVTLKEELHPLKWQTLDSDFYNMKIYAGYGNIGHMVEVYKLHKKEMDL